MNDEGWVYSDDGDYRVIKNGNSYIKKRKDKDNTFETESNEEAYLAYKHVLQQQKNKEHQEQNKITMQDIKKINKKINLLYNLFVDDDKEISDITATTTNRIFNELQKIYDEKIYNDTLSKEYNDMKNKKDEVEKKTIEFLERFNNQQKQIQQKKQEKIKGQEEIKAKFADQSQTLTTTNNVVRNKKQQIVSKDDNDKTNKAASVRGSTFAMDLAENRPVPVSDNIIPDPKEPPTIPENPAVAIPAHDEKVDVANNEPTKPITLAWQENQPSTLINSQNVHTMSPVARQNPKKNSMLFDLSQQGRPAGGLPDGTRLVDADDNSQQEKTEPVHNKSPIIAAPTTSELIEIRRTNLRSPGYVGEPSRQNAQNIRQSVKGFQSAKNNEEFISRITSNGFKEKDATNFINFIYQDAINKAKSPEDNSKQINDAENMIKMASDAIANFDSNSIVTLKNLPNKFRDTATNKDVENTLIKQLIEKKQNNRNPQYQLPPIPIKQKSREKQNPNNDTKNNGLQENAIVEYIDKPTVISQTRTASPPPVNNKNALDIIEYSDNAKHEPSMQLDYKSVYNVIQNNKDSLLKELNNLSTAAIGDSVNIARTILNNLGAMSTVKIQVEPNKKGFKNFNTKLSLPNSVSNTVDFINDLASIAQLSDDDIVDYEVESEKINKFYETEARNILNKNDDKNLLINAQNLVKSFAKEPGSLKPPKAMIKLNEQCIVKTTPQIQEYYKNLENLIIKNINNPSRDINFISNINKLKHTIKNLAVPLKTISETINPVTMSKEICSQTPELFDNRQLAIVPGCVLEKLAILDSKDKNKYNAFLGDKSIVVFDDNKNNENGVTIELIEEADELTEPLPRRDHELDTINENKQQNQKEIPVAQNPEPIKTIKKSKDAAVLLNTIKQQITECKNCGAKQIAAFRDAVNQVSINNDANAESLKTGILKQLDLLSQSFKADNQQAAVSESIQQADIVNEQLNAVNTTVGGNGTVTTVNGTITTDPTPQESPTTPTIQNSLSDDTLKALKEAAAKAVAAVANAKKTTSPVVPPAPPSSPTSPGTGGKGASTFGAAGGGGGGVPPKLSPTTQPRVMGAYGTKQKAEEYEKRKDGLDEVLTNTTHEVPKGAVRQENLVFPTKFGPATIDMDFVFNLFKTLGFDVKNMDYLIDYDTCIISVYINGELVLDIALPHHDYVTKNIHGNRGHTNHRVHFGNRVSTSSSTLKEYVMIKDWVIALFLFNKYEYIFNSVLTFNTSNPTEYLDMLFKVRIITNSDTPLASIFHIIATDPRRDYYQPLNFGQLYLTQIPNVVKKKYVIDVLCTLAEKLVPVFEKGKVYKCEKFPILKIFNFRGVSQLVQRLNNDRLKALMFKYFAAFNCAAQYYTSLEGNETCRRNDREVVVFFPVFSGETNLAKAEHYNEWLTQITYRCIRRESRNEVANLVIPYNPNRVLSLEREFMNRFFGTGGGGFFSFFENLFGGLFR